MCQGQVETTSRGLERSRAGTAVLGELDISVRSLPRRCLFAAMVPLTPRFSEVTTWPIKGKTVSTISLSAAQEENR
jgi:hypothetical protein